MIDVYAACDINSKFKDCVNFSPLPGAKYTSEANLVGRLISDIIPIILGVAGFVAVIMIVISGIQFITSSGNPEAAGAARNRLVYALIGFVVIIMSFAILQVVNALFLNSGVV